jgi:hypothetical protein
MWFRGGTQGGLGGGGGGGGHLPPPPACMLKKALTVKVLVHGLEIVCSMVNIYVMLKAVVHSSMLISTWGSRGVNEIPVEEIVKPTLSE